MIWGCFLEQLGAGRATTTKGRENVEFPLENCRNLTRRVIWHYVFRRDLGVRGAPALRWLWFGAQETTALQGEGS